MKKPHKPKPGEWVPLSGKLRMECCDCGLVHRLEFRIDEDKFLYMRGWRDNRATANRRRSLKRAKI